MAPPVQEGPSIYELRSTKALPPFCECFDLHRSQNHFRNSGDSSGRSTAGKFVREIFASDDTNSGSRRRNQPDHMLQERMSLKLHDGFVAAHSKAFTTCEYKSADGWIG